MNNNMFIIGLSIILCMLLAVNIIQTYSMKQSFDRTLALVNESSENIRQLEIDTRNLDRNIRDLNEAVKDLNEVIKKEE